VIVDEDIREATQIPGVPLPEEQTQVFGHADARSRLSGLIDAGRLPSAILLAGPQGIGKATLGFSFAREIFQRTGDETPERIREQVAAGSFPNLFVLRRAAKDPKGFYSEIRIGDIRQQKGSDPVGLRERLRMTRGRAGTRVCIIDSIDDCNTSASNALLKLLEEPPSDTLFLLISHRPGGLLPTIRSRCQTCVLRGLSDAEVAETVSSILGEAEAGREAQAVRFGAGRPRKAIEYLQMDGNDLIEQVQTWLAEGVTSGASTLALADAIVAAPETSIMFARELVTRHLADQARRAAAPGAFDRVHVASWGQLWEKARALFTEADIYNLDARQTWIMLLDEIQENARNQLQASV